MGYPDFGKAKTIVIPALIEDVELDLTLENYREKFGIDLKEFIKLDMANIKVTVDFGNSLILIDPRNTRHNPVNSLNALLPPNLINISDIGNAVSVGIGHNYNEEGKYNGVVIYIPKNNFNYESILINPYVI